ESLSAGRPGRLGAAISRAEAHKLRLSLLYALLDGSDQIRRPHLEAALAVWNYAEASAGYIFGDALGDPVADNLLYALRARPAGLTRTEISVVVFGHNRNASEIARSLDSLAARGLVNFERKATGGRPVERWYAVRATKETKEVQGHEDLISSNSFNSSLENRSTPDGYSSSPSPAPPPKELSSFNSFNSSLRSESETAPAVEESTWMR